MESSIVEADVIIIGTGFSGLGIGVALKREGERNFLILERASDVGGTWRDNTYPGAACDIQSHLYSFSFRPNPNWSRVFASQPEILSYLQETAREENILSHIRFGETVRNAAWNAETKFWEIETDNHRYRCRSLVSAAGHLSDASYPDIPGLKSFRGALFHSAQWNHDIDLTGKRVGVIGTGASAIQIVPELAGKAGHLTVFQRTAPYVIPRRDRPYSDAERGMFSRMPETMQTLRDELFWGNENRFPQRRRVPAFISMIQEMAHKHLESQVKDPALLSKLTPKYEIGCKRILISNDYYPALGRPDVRLETKAIDRVEPDAVLTVDGERILLDALIFATGFEANDPPIAHAIHGRDGRSLAEHWQNGGQAFACTCVHGFPNLFMMLGPNTGLGAGSMVYIAESQVNYVREALSFIAREGVIIEPNKEDQNAYAEDIYARAEGSVWTAGGCSSWYLHPKSGKLTSLWPDFMHQFRVENGCFSQQGFDLERADQ